MGAYWALIKSEFSSHIHEFSLQNYFLEHAQLQEAGGLLPANITSALNILSGYGT